MGMGARGLAAVVALLLASALLAGPASGEGEKPSSGQGAPEPAVPAGGAPKGDAPKESGQSSDAGQQGESTRLHKTLQPAPPPPKDTKEPSAESGKGKGAGEEQASASTPPPPSGQEPKPSPPPGGPGPNGGTGHEDAGSQGSKEQTDKLKEAMDKCDAKHKCSYGKEFYACLQVSNNASVGSLIIVQNGGPNDINITINVKEPSNIDVDKKPLHLVKGAFGQMNIAKISPDVESITLYDGNGDCVIHIRQPVESQTVSEWQQQLQQLANYAMSLNPIYGASFFVLTVVLVGIICVCCKFAKRRGNDGAPYQQLEMGAQAPNSSGVDNTTSTTDGWEDGWDDDWDDEEAPARPSDKKSTSSVSANGLSLRSQTNTKDGWDVDWDD